MATDPDTADFDEPRTAWSPWALAAVVVLILVFGVIAVGTFRGCFFVDPQQAAKDAEEQKKKEEEEKKKHKSEFVIDFPLVLPSEPKVPIPYAKPGHWQSISQNMTSNLRDFIGDSRMVVVDSQYRPFPLPKTPFDIRSNRPVLLTKERPKATETTLLVPAVPQQMQISSELDERSVGFGVPPARTPLRALKSYQYQFVVLAKEPTRYGYIKTVNSVVSPFGGDANNDDMQDTVHYQVVLLKPNETTLLPDNALTWTSVACMLWDEADPGEPFSPEQKKALIDWIHWGGQLVINGPNSLDLLKGSFLEPYLPATSAGQRKFLPDDFRDFNSYWTISTAKKQGDPLVPKAPWSGVSLSLFEDKSNHNNDAHWLPHAEGFLAERQIGRGRIIISGMQLSERDLINWRSGFESFFNACILHRPPRKFTPGEFKKANTDWADAALSDRRLDAALNSHVRYLARDLGIDTAYHYVDVAEDAPTYQSNFRQNVSKQYQASENAGGVGAWNDFNATANAARGALREAAGVEVPGADFVVLCLAVYLVALVPLNWLIFRTLGRVEWAWIAAPIIALLGTWLIIQRARLDIGFVRAQTEICVLEQQPDYQRAHLTRYTALYTSLSTTYDIQSPNPTTLLAPFPSDANFQLVSGEGLTPINFQRYDDVRLVGLPISSNSTGFVHGEQMLTLDGPIRRGMSAALNSPQIENHTKLELHSVCIVRRPTSAEQNAKGNSHHEFEGLWIGDLMPGQSAPASIRMSKTESKNAFAKDRREEPGSKNTDRLNLEPMFQLVLDPQNIEPGETRLVARCDEVFPDETITPAASQVKSAAIVVVHLEYAKPDAPRKDANTVREVKETEDQEDKDAFSQ